MPTYIGPVATARLVLRVGGHRWDPAVMVAIAGAEASWHTDEESPPNTDGSRDLGLFQINSHAHADLLRRYDWRDPLQNTTMAWLVWNPGDYRAWTTFTSGAYLRNMSVARNAVDQVERGGKQSGPPAPLPAGSPRTPFGPGPGTGRPTPTTPGQEGLPDPTLPTAWPDKVRRTGEGHVGVYRLLERWTRHIRASGQR